MEDEIQESSTENRIEALVPGWRALRGAGNSRILASSFFWFFFVPIAVRFSKANEWSRALVGGIPFSWEFFYYSAVTFAAAGLIFRLWCPGLVRDHATYSSFENAGKTQAQLSEYVRRLARRGPFYRNNYDEELLQGYCDFASDPRVLWDIWSRKRGVGGWEASLTQMAMPKEAVGDAFWFALNYADRTSSTARMVCLLLYLIGAMLFFVVAAQSFIDVVGFSLERHSLG